MVVVKKVNSNAQKEKEISASLKEKKREKEEMTKTSVISFLYDPIKTGAFYARVIVPYQAIIEFWEYLCQRAKEKHKRFRIEKPILDREFYEYISEGEVEGILMKNLDDMLNFLAYKLKEECPETIIKWAEHGNLVIYPAYLEPGEEFEGYFFFPPQAYFSDIKDAISLKVDNKAGPDFVAEVASLTQSALAEFKSFLHSIPTFEGKVTIIDEGKRHSKRHVFELYPAVAGLWIDEIAHRSVSRDIIDYLSEALNLLDARIMRMSVLLSAISTEMLLADLYEELAKKEAPEAPMGNLIKEINEIKKMPSEVTETLDKLNTLRKSAVHRGIISFTRQDAIHALMYAIRFALWYAFNAREFCGVAKKDTKHKK